MGGAEDGIQDSDGWLPGQDEDNPESAGLVLLA